MKQAKKLTAMLLCIIMLFSISTSAFAASAGPSPADNRVDVSAFSKTELTGTKVKSRNADKLIGAAFSLADFDKKVPELLKNDVLTGQNVINIIGSLSELISDKLAQDPKLSPLAGVIKYLFANDTFIRGLDQDDKFAGAVSKLNDASAAGFKNIPDVKNSEIKFTSDDFGFEDGDAYGFVDALVCSLSEFLNQLGVRMILGDFTDSDSGSTYTVGNYNLFVPLYELLELEPVSSVEFTSIVNRAEKSLSANSYTRIRTVANLTLKPLADLITEIENDSSDTVIDVLPKLIYALNSGMVNDLITGLLKDKSFFGLVQFNDMIGDLDLNTDLVWDIIDKNFVTGSENEPAGFDFDKDGEKETTLPLTKEQFDNIVEKLEFAADPVVKSSVSSTKKNRLALVTDTTLVKQIICETVVEFLESKEGNDFAKKAVEMLDGGFVKAIARSGISLFRSDFGRFILRVFQDPAVSLISLFAKLS